MKRIALLTVVVLLFFAASILFVSRENQPERPAKPAVISTKSKTIGGEAQDESIVDTELPEKVPDSAVGSVDSSGTTRGPVRSGTVILSERIDRFVKHFEGGSGDEVSFDVELLGEKFPVALTEFDRVPGSAGSGVFFGFVEGEPHSRVSWAFHGDAEIGEIQIHGQDTLKILPFGAGREHLVQAWDPLELRRCAQCLAQER